MAGPPSRERPAVRGVERLQPERVALGDRDECHDPAARAEEARDAGRGRLVEGERTAQQRSPRKQDRDLVGDSTQLGRRTLRGGDHEEGIRPPRRSGRAARRDDSAMAAADASMPMTTASGSRRARDMTARPSPVPTSITIRPARAIQGSS